VAEGFTCAVDEDYRSACEGLDCYAEREKEISEEEKEKILKERRDKDKKGEEYIEDIGGGKYKLHSRYCVLHFPDEEKDTDEFKSVLNSKLDNHNPNFRGVWFPSTWKDFSFKTFDGNADFSGATFQCADFEGATFDGDATFTKAIFRATFAEEQRTDFRRATFRGQAYFRETRFTGYTDFYRARFLGGARFIGAADAGREESKQLFSPTGRVSFNRALIEKPEQFFFDTVALHTSWFVGVDTRKFRFYSVQWYGLSPGRLAPDRLEGNIEDEISILAAPQWACHKEQEAWKLIGTTCRELHINAEENREYPLSNEFHYWSMDALRKKGSRQLGLIHTAYWALSGYGVRAARAFMALLIIWVVFTTLYVLVPSSPFSVSLLSEIKMTDGHSLGAPIQPTHVLVPLHWPSELPSKLGKAAIYSLGAIVRLRPYPRPDGPSGFQFLVTAEGIVGPLQIALLALAIRRQVMR